MTERVGQQLGNYRLIRLIGEGGFAQVYQGEHIYLGTPAAIKVLYTQLTSDDVNKFRSKAELLLSAVTVDIGSTPPCSTHPIRRLRRCLCHRNGDSPNPAKTLHIDLDIDNGRVYELSVFLDGKLAVDGRCCRRSGA